MGTKSKRSLVVYNPVSGKGMDIKTMQVYQEVLEEKGYYVDFIATQGVKHATEIVVNAEYYDIVFSVGGDGTLNEVVKGNYLRKDRMTICPLPSGTCNDVATMLGYSKNSINNLVMALEGEVNDIDIGTVNGDPFAYVVGVGALMDISYETSSEEKRKMGYLAYLKAGLSSVLSKMMTYRAEITVDGMMLDGRYSLIMVSNSNHIAGIDGFHKEVLLDDGKMEVLLCKAESKSQFIREMISYILGIPTPAVKSLKAKDITVKLLDRPKKEWCIDGEKYSYSNDTYRIRITDKMKFLTPKTKVKKLFVAKKEIFQT